MQLDKALARLSELVDNKVTLDQPDVRGWNVKTANDKVCGTVDDLIIDTAVMQVRYLDVRLDRKAPELNADNHVLIPLGYARLDDRNEDVLLSAMTDESVAALPPLRTGAVITLETARASHLDDETSFYSARDATDDAMRRSTLAEEQPVVGDGKHTPTK